MPDLLEQLREYGSFLDESARDPDTLEPLGDAAMVVQLEASLRERTGDRRWLLVAAAVVLTVVVVAGTVLVTGSGGHHVRTRAPAGQTPATTQAPPTPSVLPLGGTVVPPEGATPSTPETGELVAAVAFSPFIDFPDADRWRDTSINLYADGRLIRLAPDAPGTMAEQRLSAEGVELVRSELLSTGLFDGEQMNPDVGVSCGCQVRVRDDAGRFAVPAVGDHYPTDAERAMVDPGVKGAVDHLVEFITHLDSSLPASAWADREVKAYVPSRYQFSVWYEPYQAPAYLRLGGNNRAVPDLSNVLAQFLPTPLLQVLDERGWLHTDWADSTEVPTADARALDQVLTDLGGRFQVWQGSLVYVTHGISLGLKPFLPDGALPY